MQFSSNVLDTLHPINVTLVLLVYLNWYGERKYTLCRVKAHYFKCCSNVNGSSVLICMQCLMSLQSTHWHHQTHGWKESELTTDRDGPWQQHTSLIYCQLMPFAGISALLGICFHYGEHPGAAMTPSDGLSQGERRLYVYTTL